MDRLANSVKCQKQKYQQVSWYTPVIAAFMRLRQGDCCEGQPGHNELMANMNYTERDHASLILPTGT